MKANSRFLLDYTSLSLYKVPGHVGSIPGWGRPPGEGKGNPLQYSCLGNPMDRGAWQATVHGGAQELNMTQKLNNSSVQFSHSVVSDSL